MHESDGIEGFGFAFRYQLGILLPEGFETAIEKTSAKQVHK